MKKSSMIAVATLFWTGGIAAAAGLAYDVTRPPPDVQASLVSALPPHQTVAKKEDAMRVITLPTVELISKAQPPVTKTPPREAPAVRCSAWRPLDQGYASVQICD
jgi:hypothetical protein